MIVNDIGQVMLNRAFDVQSSGEHRLSLNVSDLSSGHYSVQVRAEKSMAMLPMVIIR
jgi:hypothetical protein